MLGFTPGFTYLGGMSEAIATPRLKTPRVKIPAGSVGIAGSQTGVYPIDSPGGWQLIGRTPVRMYDPDRETPIQPQAGQYIKFYSITKAEYDKIAAQEAAGKYVCKRHPRKETGK
jgi:KipI family sensor histidine kinase inhibitor